MSGKEEIQTPWSDENIDDQGKYTTLNKFGFFTLICCHGVVENFSTFSGRIVPQFSSSICTAASDLLSVLCKALCY